jgi:hypothetical protein
VWGMQIEEVGDTSSVSVFCFWGFQATCRAMTRTEAI